MEDCGTLGLVCAGVLGERQWERLSRWGGGVDGVG